MGFNEKINMQKMQQFKKKVNARLGVKLNITT
ncbi:unknown [[Mannheimia] succiniciproducens MBEL55E]|uniref:Uncharacterized protein n=1 Tax=Mannheimia succiniciproducens (strain KCTC 0769BP / MBEL55E) TaxID=221988 RepID=Q65QP6_MANSM|nr:unknown [[Mannheimia] succiniciproducens MBEL55E]